MIRHPLLLAVFATDSVAFLLLLTAAATAFSVALRWNPQDFGLRQLRLEARSETMTLTGAWAFGLVLFATTALVYGITNLLPGLVPGAMCGTGVLQAMHSGGPRMLLYRLVVIALFWIWWRLEKVNQALPESHLLQVNARLVLLLLPAYVLALQATWQAFQAMDFQQPVDCCAVIYDQFQSLGEARRTLGIGNGVWAWAFGVMTLSTGLAALAAWKNTTRRWTRCLLAILAAGWLPVAAIALVRAFAAYHYGVLHHYCPWCLFLPEHGLVGFPIWISWLIVALEAAAALVLARRYRRHPPLVASLANQQAGQAARNSLLALVFFTLLAVGPALWWRLQFGMWLTG
jgi:hypothetical protein